MGDCVRCKASDTKTKEAYKCQCGYIIYVKKDTKSQIRKKITHYKEKIKEFKDKISQLEKLV